MVMVGMDRGGKYNIVFEMEEVGLQIREYYTLYQLFSSRSRDKIWEYSKRYENIIISFYYLDGMEIPEKIERTIIFPQVHLK